MNKITKENKHPIIYYVDAILLIALIILVIYMQIMGKYINKEVKIIELCGGEPTSNGLITLEELGWKLTNQTNQTIEQQLKNLKNK